VGLLIAEGRNYLSTAWWLTTFPAWRSPWCWPPTVSAVNLAENAHERLTVENLRISYRSQRRMARVVHNVSFALKRGEMLAFVGESGSGKTTTAQAIIGLLADNARRDSGRISINGEEISGWSAKRLDSLRGARISLVPQDPGNSLNPVKTIGAQVGEILRLHQKAAPRSVKSRCWPC
jgi:peptide/nickel transport system ATP-binding protein